MALYGEEYGFDSAKFKWHRFRIKHGGCALLWYVTFFLLLLSMMRSLTVFIPSSGYSSFCTYIGSFCSCALACGSL